MSYKLALNTVYQLNPNEVPRDKYQTNAQLLVQQQAVFAGCRVAALLNKVAHS
ncbi:MAG: hypothetical protein ACRCXC_10000 [Legionella sp.]